MRNQLRRNTSGLWSPLGTSFLEVPGIQYKMSRNRGTTEKSFLYLKGERISVTIKPVTCEYCKDEAFANLFFHLCDIKKGASYFKYSINTTNKGKKYFYISIPINYFHQFSQIRVYKQSIT